jgi:hypothetical protein
VLALAAAAPRLGAAVFGLRPPLEIDQPVICRVVVVVQGLQSGWTRSDEGFEHQPVDSVPPALHQTNFEIAVVGGLRLEQLPRDPERPAIRPRHYSADRSNATLVGHLVAVVPDYGSPCLSINGVEHHA